MDSSGVCYSSDGVSLTGGLNSTHFTPNMHYRKGLVYTLYTQLDTTTYTLRIHSLHTCIYKLCIGTKIYIAGTYWILL